MSFSPEWLALREPFDRAAREASSLDLQALQASAAQSATNGTPYRVLDLGCGTGANLRVLAPRLGGKQRWHLVDHDARLLAELPSAMTRWAETHRLKTLPDSAGNGLVIEAPEWRAHLSWQKADLVRQLDELPFEGSQLVTTSALLDLVSASWLAALLTKVHEARAALLCALSVDGRIDWQPAMSSDAQMSRLFAAHQHSDKGFGGPALGADAVPRAVERLVALGYRCLQAGSDWELAAPSGGARLLVQMIDGLADAALRQDPGSRDLVLTWRLQRLAQAAHSSLRIGHAELLALPGK
ncbi:MAG: class I SAM-dependent methyltransferase [Proteobacteria bacterium]|nr:class I SAM-dependent methyltransferase [Pseudomonadota bacterium]